MESKFRILVINPGSTSTKIAIYDNEEQLFEETLRHSTKELEVFDTILEQYTFRKEAIIKALQQRNIELSSLSGIVGRGGILEPIEGGTYILEDNLVNALRDWAIKKGHACNLAGLIANDLVKELGINAYMVDPPCVDELADVARITGLEGTTRTSMFHALNQKAVARRAAKKLGKRYEDCNFIIAHVGGGISVGAHKNGRVIDVNNALDGDGPFSPERAGEIPTSELVELCFSGEYTKQQIKKMLTGKGGIVSYLGINDMRIVEDMMDKGDKKASIIYDAMVYQVAKAIGAMSTVLMGEYDQIILTGGIAYSKLFSKKLKERVDFLGDFVVFPGEDELIALAEGGLRILRNEEKAKIYQ
ncbi:butyrate kinase 1 [Vallitalea longa]|uniref:Probable butyrate kinase n=1 Tax=Vallitalea longa TaxID=2936439 RepID=A0A9W5YFT4_9FIRM|nr:butyrate kinase [Vallitalea longa]GKX32264.1 butyrate kinase 1 [Vallitalea longa]